MKRRLVCSGMVVWWAGVLGGLDGKQAIGDWPEAFCLAAEGKARAALVVPATSPEIVRLGAEAVRERVRGLTGVDLPVADRAEGPRVALRVDPQAEEFLGDEGFTAVVTDQGASVTGRGPRGVYHGANWLARRILPRKGRDAWLPRLRVRERPVLPSRGIYDGEWESWVNLGLDVELDAAWWNEYVGLLSSFGANRFEFWDFLTAYLPSADPDSRWHRLLRRNRALAGFAHARGMELLAVWTADVPPVVLEEHPDWRAVGDGGSLVCPSNPEALDYLLAQRRQVLEAERDLFDGVVLYGYDPGGCDCASCGGKHRDWYRTWMRLVNRHQEVVREVAPRLRVVPMLWLFRPEEREQILRHLDEWPQIEEIEAEIFTFDPPLMETMRGFAARKRLIQWDHESDMEGVMWLENPFFRRIRERIRRTHQAGYQGAMGFILAHPVKLLNSLYLVQQAWNPERSEDEVLRELTLGLFASDDARLVEALKRLEVWAEVIGPTPYRLGSRSSPQITSSQELRRALDAASAARRLLLQAERSVHLRKDYWQYLVHLAAAEEAIPRRLLAQSQAYAAWDEAEAQEEVEARVGALARAARFLAEASRENAAIAEALRATPLANMREDLFRTREGILNEEILAREADQLEAERELFSAAPAEWERLGSAPWAEPTAEGRVPVLVGFREAVKNVVLCGPLEARGSKAARVFEVDPAGATRSLNALTLPGPEGGWDRVCWFLPGVGSLGAVRRVHLYLGPQVQALAPLARLPQDPHPLDPGFEERARWWKWYGPPGVNLSWSREAHEGRYAAQLEITHADDHLTFEATPDNARAMALQPGKVYRFRFFARAVQGEPQFYANLYGGSEADGPHVFGHLPADGQWHEVTLTVPAPEGPADTLLWPRIVALQQQVLLIDDFCIEPEEPAPEQVVDLQSLASAGLSDSSMERGRNVAQASSRPVSDWELDVSASPAVRARWSSQAHTGRAAARLEILQDAPGEWASVCTAPQNSRRLQARPGETYRVAFWCRRVKGAPRFYLDFYGGTLESDGPETYPALPADTNWHKRVVLVRAPDGPADVLLTLRFVAHSKAGTLLLDDVQAEPATPAILAVGPYQARD